ncbi:MAG: aminoglycoside phosphotransferase family protein [Bacillota bacterium]
MKIMELGKPIASGNTADIFLYKNKAIKIFKDHLPNSEAQNEAIKQKIAHCAGLPVPEVIEVTNINGKQAIIMEYVEGKTLGELFFDDKNKAEKYLKMSIDIQQQIHRIIPQSLESMNDKLFNQIKSVPQLNESVKSNLLKKMALFSYESRLCHGDFHLYNLISTDDEIVIIDWVDSSSGDIRADVYRTYLLYSQFNKNLAEKYLEIYCKESGLLRSEIFEWAPIIAAARLSEGGSFEDEMLLMKIILGSHLHI